MVTIATFHPGLVNSSKFLGKVGSEKKEEKSGKPREEKLNKDTKQQSIGSFKVRLENGWISKQMI